jgi:hypothetical protein
VVSESTGRGHESRGLWCGRVTVVVLESNGRDVIE